MTGECAARLRHLHQTEHAFVHTRAAGSRNDDDRGVFIGAVFDRARDPFPNDGAHGRGEKSEIHCRQRNLVTVDHSMAANDSVSQPGAFLIILEAVFVACHALKTQRVDGFQIGIHFDERLRIEQIVDSVLGRNGKVIIAPRTNAQILIQLDFMDHFIAAGAFLKQALRNVAFLARLGFERRFFENGHGNQARAAVAA